MLADVDYGPSVILNKHTKKYGDYGNKDVQILYIFMGFVFEYTVHKQLQFVCNKILDNFICSRKCFALLVKCIGFLCLIC